MIQTFIHQLKTSNHKIHEKSRINSYKNPFFPTNIKTTTAFPESFQDRVDVFEAIVLMLLSSGYQK